MNTYLVQVFTRDLSSGTLRESTYGMIKFPKWNDLACRRSFQWWLVLVQTRGIGRSKLPDGKEVKTPA